MNRKPCENILCVDDEENVLQMFRRTLGRQFNTINSASADHALKLLKEHEFAVIISDYNMPDINGLEFLKRAKELAPECVQIMLTGNIDLNIAIKAINETDIFRYLPKPCPSEVLVKVINDALDQYRLLKEKNRLSQEVQQKNQELETSNTELAKQKYLLEYELEMARIVFAKASQDSNSNIPGLDYIAIAKETVGGDFMLNCVQQGRHIHYLMIGDLTGHGLQSALAVLLVTEIFSALTRDEPGIINLARAINDKMCQKLPTGIFCAAILIRIDSLNRKIQLWQGGMPDACLLDADGKIIQLIKSNNLPLGVVSDANIPFQVAEFELDRSGIDSLFIYSDGVNEQNNLQSVAFGIETIRKALSETPENKRRVDYVLEKLLHFQESQPQSDDISLFELKFNPLFAFLESI